MNTEWHRQQAEESRELAEDQRQHTEKQRNVEENKRQMAEKHREAGEQLREVERIGDRLVAEYSTRALLARLGACPRINVFSLGIPGEPGSLYVQSDHAAATLSAADGHGQCPDGRTPGQGLLRVHMVPSHRIRP
jgi:hypothetical protein